MKNAKKVKRTLRFARFFAMIKCKYIKEVIAVKSFTIQTNDAGQRLDKYLSKSVPNLPQALMYKYIRLKRIKLNHKRAQISTRLQVGGAVYQRRVL